MRCLLVIALLCAPLCAQEVASEFIIDEAGWEKADRKATHLTVSDRVPLRDEHMAAVLEFKALNNFTAHVTRLGGPGVAQLARITGLQYLTLRAWRDMDDDALRALGALTNLKQLTLEFATPVDGAFVKAFAGAAALANLRLMFSEAGPGLCAGLGALKQASMLDLGVGKFNGSPDYAALAGMTGLRLLDLRGGVFAPALLQHISRSITMLRVAPECKFDDAHAAAVKAAPELASLHLPSCQIGNLGLEALAVLPKLRMLDLVACAGFNDDGMKALAKSKSLKGLVINDCKQLKDASLDALASLGLTSLSASNCGFSNDAVRRFQQKNPDCFVVTVPWSEGRPDAPRDLPAASRVEVEGDFGAVITSVGELSALPDESEALWVNFISSDATADELKRFTKVRRLRLDQPRAANANLAEIIAGMARLEELVFVMYHPSARDFSPLGALPLKRLGLYQSSSIDSLLTAVATCPIEALELDFGETYPNRPNVQPDQLRLFPKLRKLRLTAAGVYLWKDFEVFSEMQLRSLTLQFELVRDAIAIPLVRMPLTEVDLRACYGIDDTVAKRFVSSGLKSLNLVSTDITDATLKEIKKAGKLEYLNLRGCYYISNEGIKSLAGLKELRRLYLGQCDGLTAACLPHLSTLLNLSMLDLEGMTGFTPERIAALAPLAGLSWLSMQRISPVLDEPLSELRSKLAGARMDVSKGSGPPLSRTPRWLTARQLSDLELMPEGTRAVLFQYEPTGPEASAMKKFRNLRCLAFANSLHDVVQWAATLKNIEVLHINASPKLDGRVFAELGKMKSLIELRAEISNTVNARHLRSLAKSKSLKRLYLVFGVEDAGPAKFTPDEFKAISEIATLEDLGFYQLAGIDDRAFEALGALKTLRGLRLHRCPGIADLLIGELVRQMPNLELLMFIDCPDLADDAMDHVFRLGALRQLNLEGCPKVTPPWRARFRTNRPDVLLVDG